MTDGFDLEGLVADLAATSVRRRAEAPAASDAPVDGAPARDRLPALLAVCGIAPRVARLEGGLTARLGPLVAGSRSLTLSDACGPERHRADGCFALALANGPGGDAAASWGGGHVTGRGEAEDVETTLAAIEVLEAVGPAPTG